MDLIPFEIPYFPLELICQSLKKSRILTYYQVQEFLDLTSTLKYTLLTYCIRIGTRKMF